MLQNNVENMKIHNDNRYNVTSWYTKPCSANILWISNAGLQRLPKKQCFIVNNITIPKLIHENPIEIQVVKSDKSKKNIKNNREIIRVRSKSNKVTYIEFIHQIFCYLNTRLLLMRSIQLII